MSESNPIKAGGPLKSINLRRAIPLGVVFLCVIILAIFIIMPRGGVDPLPDFDDVEVSQPDEVVNEVSVVDYGFSSEVQEDETESVSIGALIENTSTKVACSVNVDITLYGGNGQEIGASLFDIQFIPPETTFPYAAAFVDSNLPVTVSDVKVSIGDFTLAESESDCPDSESLRFDTLLTNDKTEVNQGDGFSLVRTSVGNDNNQGVTSVNTWCVISDVDGVVLGGFYYQHPRDLNIREVYPIRERVEAPWSNKEPRRSFCVTVGVLLPPQEVPEVPDNAYLPPEYEPFRGIIGLSTEDARDLATGLGYEMLVAETVDGQLVLPDDRNPKRVVVLEEEGIIIALIGFG